MSNKHYTKLIFILCCFLKGGIKIAKRVYYDANVAAKFNKPPFANRWYHANCLKIFDEV